MSWKPFGGGKPEAMERVTMMSQLLKHGNIRTSCSSITRTEQSPRKTMKNKGQKGQRKNQTN
jgi:hypothetical protein